MKTVVRVCSSQPKVGELDPALRKTYILDPDNCIQYRPLIIHIQSTRTLIQDQYIRSPHQRPRNLQSLSLSTRDERSVLPKVGIISIRQTLDKIVDVRRFGSTVYLANRYFGSISDVLCYTRVK